MALRCKTEILGIAAATSKSREVPQMTDSLNKKWRNALCCKAKILGIAAATSKSPEVPQMSNSLNKNDAMALAYSSA